MKITSAEFISSSIGLEGCPPPHLPEYAFIGRSNVGKSSLINMLTGFQGLAKISSKPGKTQTINHFMINKAWYLTDLPGYGWARVSQSERKRWVKMIHHYLTKRENLCCVFVLADLSIAPQKIDLEFMENLGHKQVPFVIVFTKTDKQSATANKIAIEKYIRLLEETWEEAPRYFKASSLKRSGREDILYYIEEVNGIFQKHSF